MPKRKWRTGYKIRLVLCDESRALDSMAITISHRIAAIQAFSRLCRSALKCVSAAGGRPQSERYSSKLQRLKAQLGKNY